LTERPLRVCLVLEGSYPYITGGVSAWVQDLVTGLPDIEFSLFTISPKSGQELRYKLPANIVEHRDVVLGSAGAGRGPRGATKRAIGETVSQHLRMFAGSEPSIRALIEVLPEDMDLSDGSVEDPRAWELIRRMNRQRNPAYPFADYFWAWRSAHSMLFDVLRAKAPEADLYHAISTGFAGLAALAAGQRRGKPFLLTEHGLYHKEREIEIRKSSFIRGYQRDMWIKVYKRISAVCYREADGITSLFEENRRKQLELGAAPEKCRVIPNGIDLSRFAAVIRAPRPGFHVGLVGRIVPIKDVKTFVSAARIVLDKLPEARFYAIGPTDEDPEYYEECVALAERLRVSDRLEFTGRKNVLEYYAFLDLMLLTSVREAQPLVIIEGWAAGVPTAATRVGNVPEMLDDDDRFLAPSKDAGKLAESVLWAHRHPAELAEINKRNRQKAFARHDRSAMLDAYRAFYEESGARGDRARGDRDRAVERLEGATPPGDGAPSSGEVPWRA